MFKFITTRLILNHINYVNIKKLDNFRFQSMKQKAELNISDCNHQKDKPKVSNFNHQKKKLKASDFFPPKNNFPENTNMVVILPCCVLILC